MQTNPDMCKTLRRLMVAAQNRENTMGDPIRLIEVRAELREAARQAQKVLTNYGS